MTDDERPGETYSAKTSASGHGQAYSSQRDMTNQDITIKDSVVVVVMRRVEETMERVQYAETLRDGVDELKTRLAAMTEAARIAAARLKREVDRARSEGRQEALVEAEAHLQDAERRRREVEARLQQAQEERDRAVQLMQQAQLQALNARNELEELRRREQLEADLAQARTELQRAATAGGTVRAEAYADQIASADAELGDFHEQLALLSVELEESSEPEPVRAASSTSDTSGDSARVPLVQVAEKVQENTEPRTPKLEAGHRPGASVRAGLSNSQMFGTVMSTPVLIALALVGSGINIMIHAHVGPAILWQILYALIAVVAVVIGMGMYLVVVESMMGAKNWARGPAEIRMGLMSLGVGPLILIAAIIFPSRTVPVLAPIAHWIVTVFGPLGH